jgi:uncharacterized protein (DUF1330 family)
MQEENVRKTLQLTNFARRPMPPGAVAHDRILVIEFPTRSFLKACHATHENNGIATLREVILSK